MAIGTVPVLLHEITTAAAGWRDLLPSQPADVAVTSDSGLLPELESAKWGHSGTGPDTGADHAKGCSVDGHVCNVDFRLSRELRNVEVIEGKKHGKDCL